MSFFTTEALEISKTTGKKDFGEGIIVLFKICMLYLGHAQN